ncbi:unnamed protein product [Litomosoides sigmodontis]|uniref:Uncharacterized protein n=1 Tax=Litomosoides sigmodontis TaxID=42156 RepID=A0A3P6V0W0_LITSI|nr:unnamed protein product [Litomosoides sigmodontis]
MEAQESLTGDAHLESGLGQSSAPSSSASVPSPQTTSKTNRAATKQQSIRKNDSNATGPPLQNSEQKKYWEYRNVYHIPVPQGIEFWEDEDKKRWEMINIGGLDESEANRRIKRAKMQQVSKRRQWQVKQPQTGQRRSKIFIPSLMCFGLQLFLAVVCIGICTHQIVNNSQIQSGIAFLLLALIPLVGAAGGIFSALMRSEMLALCAAIYNVASAVGVIVATINVYSFKIDHQDSLSAFIPVAGIIALVQTISFGVVLVIYLNILTSKYPRCTVLSPTIPSIEVESSRSKRRELEARERNELKLNAAVRDVTQKYKQYLQEKGQIAEKPKEEVQEEGSSRKSAIWEEQAIELPELKKAGNKVK